MNHEQPPETRAPREPDPHGWNLPISLPAAEALGKRLDNAVDTESIISNQDARIIALCLSDRLGAGLHSAIRQFADTGSLHVEQLRAECLSAFASQDLEPGLKRWTAWLTTYVAYALPPNSGGFQISSNGDALEAYLRLPDVDCQRETTLEEFGHAYCGSYAGIEAVLNGVTDVLEWERKIRALARSIGCEDFIFLDREAIERRMREGWDIVPGRGQLHVFFR
ncbi:MAG: hypothetical protein PGN37_01040 [Mycobacterium kyogaense]|uniref:hypothetical protein n=1 Tax=Mycobacterium kyogaense TaxID=2212479 RepID=UPI002FF81CBF